MKRFALAAVVSVAALSGCGTMNNYLAQKTKTVEYYRIFDIKTNAPRQVVIKAASDGIGRNVNNAREATPIPSSGKLPETPGRFTLANPFEGSKIAVLMSGGGSLGLRMATCEGAVWTATAQRDVTGDNTLNLTACVFQYKDGYHLDLYAVFMKQEGGLLQIGRDIAHSMVGAPEEWTEKTFTDIARSIRINASANVALLEAQPAVAGAPWLDAFDFVKK